MDPRLAAGRGEEYRAGALRDRQAALLALEAAEGDGDFRCAPLKLQAAFLCRACRCGCAACVSFCLATALVCRLPTRIGPWLLPALDAQLPRLCGQP